MLKIWGNVSLVGSERVGRGRCVDFGIGEEGVFSEMAQEGSVNWHFMHFITYFPKLCLLFGSKGLEFLREALGEVTPPTALCLYMLAIFFQSRKLVMLRNRRGDFDIRNHTMKHVSKTTAEMFKNRKRSNIMRKYKFLVGVKIKANVFDKISSSKIDDFLAIIFCLRIYWENWLHLKSQCRKSKWNFPKQVEIVSWRGGSWTQLNYLPVLFE